VDPSIHTAKTPVAFATVFVILPHCESTKEVIAVITDPEEVRNILRHLVKVGRPPPGLVQSFV